MNADDDEKRLLTPVNGREQRTSSRPVTPLPDRRLSGRLPLSRPTRSSARSGDAENGGGDDDESVGSEPERKQHQTLLPGAVSQLSSPLAAGGDAVSSSSEDDDDHLRIQRDAAPFSAYNPKDVAASGVVQAFVKAYMSRRALAMSATYLEENANWVGSEEIRPWRRRRSGDEQKHDEEDEEWKKKQQQQQHRPSKLLRRHHRARRDSLWQSITTAFVRQPSSTTWTDRRDSMAVIPLSPASARPAEPLTPNQPGGRSTRTAANTNSNKNRRGFLFPNKEI